MNLISNYLEIYTSHEQKNYLVGFNFHVSIFAITFLDTSFLCSMFNQIAYKTEMDLKIVEII